MALSKSPPVFSSSTALSGVATSQRINAGGNQRAVVVDGGAAGIKYCCRKRERLVAGFHHLPALPLMALSERAAGVRVQHGVVGNVAAAGVNVSGDQRAAADKGCHRYKIGSEG